MIVDKIENYLNSIDKKNLILCYLSIALLIGLIYYNFNYSILGDKIKRYNQKIEFLKNKIKNNKFLYLKLEELKRNINTLKIKNLFLKKDIKYINMLINSSKMFNINKEGFFIILKDILQKAVNNNIKASYKVAIDVNKFKIYSIHVNGNFNKNNFLDFFNFIKNLESIKNIKKIKNLLIVKKDNLIEFSLVIIFWSIS